MPDFCLILCVGSIFISLHGPNFHALEVKYLQTNARLNEKQGHHHIGDQAARLSHMMCSICNRRFTTPLFGGGGVPGDWNVLIRYPAHAFLSTTH